MSENPLDTEPSDSSEIREAMYLLLSQFFAMEIDWGAWETLAYLPFMTEDYLESVGAEDKSLREAAARLDDFHGSTSPREPDEVLLELAREYAALFLGVGPDTVSLCESQYHKAGFHSGENPVFAVRDLYASAGLDKNEEFKEPEDHLAMELAFMAHLCGRMAETKPEDCPELISTLAAQRDFIEFHLLSWVPAAADKIAAAHPDGFYGKASAFLVRFVELENSFIGRRLRDFRP